MAQVEGLGPQVAVVKLGFEVGVEWAVAVAERTVPDLTGPAVQVAMGYLRSLQAELLAAIDWAARAADAVPLLRLCVAVTLYAPTANLATPAEQIAVATRLYNARGSSPWPVCGANL